MSNNNSWFICPIKQPNPSVRLFCFPYAGGGTIIYKDWLKRFPSNIEVHMAQLPGRERRFNEQLPTSVEAITSAFRQEIKPFLHQPFIFFGHSMGALLAYELTRELIKEEGVSPEILFVSAKSAPHINNSREYIHKLPSDEFWDKLIKLNGTPKEIVENDELMKLYEPTLRKDFEICDSYLFEKSVNLTCPISVFGGTDDITINKEELEAWQELSTGAFKLRMVEGDHFYIRNQQKYIQDSIQYDAQNLLKQVIL